MITLSKLKGKSFTFQSTSNCSFLLFLVSTFFVLIFVRLSMLRAFFIGVVVLGVIFVRLLLRMFLWLAVRCRLWILLAVWIRSVSIFCCRSNNWIRNTGANAKINYFAFCAWHIRIAIMFYVIVNQFLIENSLKIRAFFVFSWQNSLKILRYWKFWWYNEFWTLSYRAVQKAMTILIIFQNAFTGKHILRMYSLIEVLSNRRNLNLKITELVR